MAKSTKIILFAIGFLFIVGIIIFIVVLMKKKKEAAVVEKNTNTQTPSTDPNCVPYTKEMESRDLTKIRSKCFPQAAIPIVGPGLYVKCVASGKGNLPVINNC